MKKSSKTKGQNAPEATEEDIAGLIVRVMQQISYLDKKVDKLIAQAAERPAEAKHYPAPFQHVSRGGCNDQPRPDFRDRVMYKAVCADCSKECEVPFKPSGNRPVYCKECFSKRRDDNPFKEDRPGGGRHESREGRQKAPFYKKFVGRDHRAGEKKKPVVRGRRKKSK